MNEGGKNSHSGKMRVLPHWDWLKSPTALLHFVIRITELRTELLPSIENAPSPYLLGGGGAWVGASLEGDFCAGVVAGF